MTRAVASRDGDVGQFDVLRARPRSSSARASPTSDISARSADVAPWVPDPGRSTRCRRSRRPPRARRGRRTPPPAPRRDRRGERACSSRRRPRPGPPGPRRNRRGRRRNRSRRRLPSSPRRSAISTMSVDESASGDRPRAAHSWPTNTAAPGRRWSRPRNAGSSVLTFRSSAGMSQAYPNWAVAASSALRKALPKLDAAFDPSGGTCRWCDRAAADAGVLTVVAHRARRAATLLQGAVVMNDERERREATGHLRVATERATTTAEALACPRGTSRRGPRWSGSRTWATAARWNDTPRRAATYKRPGEAAVEASNIGTEVSCYK